MVIIAVLVSTKATIRLQHSEITNYENENRLIKKKISNLEQISDYIP